MNKVSQAGKKVVMMLAASALIGVATFGVVSADTISPSPSVAESTAEPTVDPAADGVPNPTVYLPIVQSDASSGNVIDKEPSRPVDRKPAKIDKANVDKLAKEVQEKLKD